MNMKKMFLAIAFLIVAAFNLMAEPQAIVAKNYGSDKHTYLCFLYTSKEYFSAFKDAEALVDIFDPIDVCHKYIPFAKKEEAISFCQTIKTITNDLNDTEKRGYLSYISDSIHSAISNYANEYYPDLDYYADGYLCRLYITYKGK